MNPLNRNFNFIFLLLFFINIDLAIADQCPSAETVRQRKISREYDWSIDERRSLEDVLAVEKLYSVRIKNKGEFIACYYMGKNGLLRLDGVSLEKNCFVKKTSGKWEETETAEQICKEKELSTCIFEIHCNNVE